MIVVLLPAYNEEASLPRLLPKLRDVLATAGEPYRIVVCNDGSRDATAEVLEAARNVYPLEVLTHRINRGLGETVRDLFERAVEIVGPGDVIIRLDCDDTHEPEFVPRLVAKVREGHDVVIASASHRAAASWA